MITVAHIIKSDNMPKRQRACKALIEISNVCAYNKAARPIQVSERLVRNLPAQLTSCDMNTSVNICPNVRVKYYKVRAEVGIGRALQHPMEPRCHHL